MAKRHDHYILDSDGNPVGVDDPMEWAFWFENADDARRVARDSIGDDVKVSTVFLGLDHSFGSEGPPLLFETMVFGGDHDQWQDRYATREEALKGHRKAIEMVEG